MRASNRAVSDRDHPAEEGLPGIIDAVLAGRLGYSVRCRPGCRTMMVDSSYGRIFCKLREGDRAAAEAEWHWLHLLPMLGLGVPQPLAFERRGARTLLCTAPAPGRPLDALLREVLEPVPGDDAAREAERLQRLEQAVQFCCDVVAPRVRTLHDQGVVFRDLYWNHLFTTGFEPGSDLVFLDVERAFRPRFRKFRWLVKDLAGLLASLPGRLPTRVGLRFLRAYLAERKRDRWLSRRLIRAVVKKAEAIRSHRPKYGS